MPLKPSGRYSNFGTPWRSMIEDDELQRYKEEKERWKFKVGGDRKRFIDDVFAS